MADLGHMKDSVWDKAKPMRGKDPKMYRQDPYGNQMDYSSYGQDTRRGWEIDHIKPKSLGGSDHIRNLQAMNTAKNRELGDSRRRRSRHSQKKR